MTCSMQTDKARKETRTARIGGVLTSLNRAVKERFSEKCILSKAFEGTVFPLGKSEQAEGTVSTEVLRWEHCRGRSDWSRGREK